MDIFVGVRACACVCIPSHWDQMKYSSVSVAIDQRSVAPMMDTPTLIAPPMPSVSLTHTLLHSHSFIYLFFFLLPDSQSPHSFPLPTLWHTNRNKSDLIKLNWEGGLPEGCLFHVPWQLPQCRTSVTWLTLWPKLTLLKKVPDIIVVSHTENCLQPRSLQNSPSEKDKSLGQWFPKWSPGTSRGLWEGIQNLRHVRGNSGVWITLFLPHCSAKQYLKLRKDWLKWLKLAGCHLNYNKLPFTSGKISKTRNVQVQQAGPCPPGDCIAKLYCLLISKPFYIIN